MLLKAKDYFTLGNAFSGFMSTIFVLRGDLVWAGYMMLIAFVFDFSDGIVARLTKQFNKFGAELDNVADLIAYSVAPAFYVYGYYTQHPTFTPLPWPVAMAVGSLPLLAGCIRFARFNVKRIHYDGAWIGMPRPVAAFLFVGYFGSSIAQTSALIYYGGILLVIYASAMHFVLVPFVNHHGPAFPRSVRTVLFFSGTSTLAAALVHVVTALLEQARFQSLGIVPPSAYRFGLGLTFEVTTFWMLCYTFFASYLVFPPKEREAIRRYVRDWKADESSVG